MRIGELVALRWRYVRFLPDHAAAIVAVNAAFGVADDLPVPDAATR